jgi:hypothetical protein
MGTAGAMVGGMFGADDFANQRPTHFSDIILYDYPQGPAKLTMMLGRLKPKSVDDVKFTIFEKGLQAQRAKILTDLTEGATSIVLDGTTSLGATPTDYFRAGMILEIEATGEIVRVESVTQSTDTLTVTRDLDGGAATNDYSVDVSDVTYPYVSVVHSAEGEGSVVPGALSENPNEIYNYIGITKTPMFLTGTAKETFLRTGKVEKEKKFEIGIEHSRKLENALFHSVRWTGTDSVTGETVRTSGGLDYWVNTNYTDFLSDGGVSLRSWEAFLEPIYSGPASSEEKIAFCGAGAMSALNLLALENSVMNQTPGDRAFGMRFKEYHHAHGILQCMSHPLLTANPKYKYSVYIVDPANIRRRFLQNRDTRFQENIGNPERDAIVSQFVSDHGLQLEHETTHGIAHNVLDYLS